MKKTALLGIIFSFFALPVYAQNTNPQPVQGYTKPSTGAPVAQKSFDFFPSGTQNAPNPMPADPAVGPSQTPNAAIYTQAKPNQQVPQGGGDSDDQSDQPNAQTGMSAAQCRLGGYSYAGNYKCGPLLPGN